VRKILLSFIVIAAATSSAIVGVDVLEVSQTEAWNRVFATEDIDETPNPIDWGSLVSSDASAEPTAVDTEVSPTNAGERWRVEYGLELPLDSIVLQRIRRGIRTIDTDALVATFAGTVSIDESTFALDDPVIEQKPSASSARVTIVGDMGNFSSDSATQRLRIERPEFAFGRASRSPRRTTKVYAGNLTITSISGTAPTVQSAHEAEFDSPGPAAATEISLYSTDAGANSDSSEDTSIYDYLLGAWGNIWYGFLGILAWLVVYVLGIRGHLGGSRRIRSLVTLIGIVVAITATVRWAGAMTWIESLIFYRESWSLLVPDIQGSYIVALLSVGVAMPLALHEWNHCPPDRTTRQRRSLIASGIVGGTLSITIASLPLLVARERGTSIAAGSMLGIAALLTASMGMLWFTRLGWLWPYALVATGGATVVTSTIGLLPHIQAYVAEQAVELVIVASTGTLALVSLTLTGWKAWSDRFMRQTGRPYLWIATCASIAVALPIDTAYVLSPAISSTLGLADSLIAIAGLLVVLVIARLIVDQLRLPPNTGTGRDAGRMRVLGLCFGLVTFIPRDAVIGELPLALLAGSALLWWWALRPPNAAETFSLVVSEHRHTLLVAALLRARDAERSVPKLRKSLRGQVESAKLSYESAIKKVDRLESVAQRTRGGAGVGAARLEEAALGSYRWTPAWRQAARGALAGFILGLPWSVLAIPGILAVVSEGEAYPALSVIGVGVWEWLRWGAYGFFFGAMFPLLRGTTGLSKGLTLFVTIGVPAAIAALSAHELSADHLPAQIFQISQLFIHSMLLGIGADLLALRRAGQRFSRLIDVHNLGALAAWGSTVTAAIGVAIASAVAAGVTALVVGMLPADGRPQQSPPSNPSQTSSVSPIPSPTGR
jgi:hypothetical protein